MEAVVIGIWFFGGVVAGVVGSMAFFYTHTQKTLDALAAAVAEVAKLKAKL